MNRFWLGLVILTWRTFQSVEGAKGKCLSPLTVEFAEFFAESYQVGTQVKYECEEGYKRPGGQARIIKCISDRDGFGQWTPVVCIVDPSLPLRPSTQPVTQIGEESGRTDGPLSKAQPPMKGFCGVLTPSKHVKAGPMSYTVGQELQYRCMDGYQARSPISEKSTCQDAGGSIVWSELHLRCTNIIEEEISPETGVSVNRGYSHDSSLAAIFALALVATVVI